MYMHEPEEKKVERKVRGEKRKKEREMDTDRLRITQHNGWWSLNNSSNNRQTKGTQVYNN